MPRLALAALATCSTLAPAVAVRAQQPREATHPAGVVAEASSDRQAKHLFYRAFFFDRGLERTEEALALYQHFLEAAPEHRMAGQAARFAVQLLRKAKRSEEAKALERRHRATLAETIPAGINASFLDPSADVARLVNRFEAESREVFKHRKKLVRLVNPRSGQVVADIGAGTGFFTNLFARAVGPEGKVHAVEIGPKLVEHLRNLARTMQLPQVEVVRCTERSTTLQPASIDVAFICDSYHHFEHPAATLASIHEALRSRGQLVVIDFKRIPGKTRQWLLDHVRAGQGVFTKEIEAAGFKLVREEKAGYLEENYVLRFEKK